MKNKRGRILSRKILKGLKIVSISALSSLVAIYSPWAVLHASAAGPVKFTTYLMIEEDGEFATDSRGEYIQLIDEKGNLLAYNDDVKAFLKRHSDEESRSKLAAKEKSFYLIDGKLYLDEAGENELTDLSKVMPAIFKYGTIDDGYTLEADDSTIYINPLEVKGRPVYVARVSGDYEKLPAFTISSKGIIGYLEKGFATDGENVVPFIYDSNYFYDNDLNQLTSMEVLVPEAGEEGAPMFAGYYIKNGEERRQFLDIDGAIVMSAGDYMAIAGNTKTTEAEYCYLISFYADGCDSLTVYSDLNDGTLYSDYQRMNAFDNIGGDLLWQVTSDEARGHFAGYYAGEEDGSFTRVIDDGGNLIQDSVGVPDSNKDYYARFYHILNADGSDEGSEIYFSDGSAYSDSELMTQITNIADVIGGIPEDHEEKVHSDERDMDGVAKKYFVGYYFASDFGSEDGEEDVEKDVLLSEYDEENFDPADVEINKVKFADRDGNIVFNSEDAPAIDTDMGIYQNWYTVTVWDDGEVEINDEADEVKEKTEDPEEETEGEEVPEDKEKTDDEKSDGEKSDGEKSDEEKKADEQGEGVQPGDKQDEKPAAEGEEALDDGTGKDAQEAGEKTDAQGSDSEDNDNKEGVQENAKPEEADQGTGNGSDSGDGDNNDGSDAGNSKHANTGNTDVVMTIMKTEDDGEE